jgi:hypothetical protein
MRYGRSMRNLRDFDAVRSVLCSDNKKAPDNAGAFELLI